MAGRVARTRLSPVRHALSASGLEGRPLQALGRSIGGEAACSPVGWDRARSGPSNGGAGGQPGLLSPGLGHNGEKCSSEGKAVHLALHCAHLDTLCKFGSCQTYLYFHRLEILDVIAFPRTDLYQGSPNIQQALKPQKHDSSKICRPTKPVLRAQMATATQRQKLFA